VRLLELGVVDEAHGERRLAGTCAGNGHGISCGRKACGGLKLQLLCMVLVVVVVAVVFASVILVVWLVFVVMLCMALLGRSRVGACGSTLFVLVGATLFRDSLRLVCVCCWCRRHCYRRYCRGRVAHKLGNNYGLCCHCFCFCVVGPLVRVLHVLIAHMCDVFLCGQPTMLVVRKV
jgi:hypothetical protein